MVTTSPLRSMSSLRMDSVDWVGMEAPLSGGPFWWARNERMRRENSLTVVSRWLSVVQVGHAAPGSGLASLWGHHNLLIDALQRFRRDADPSSIRIVQNCD